MFNFQTFEQAGETVAVLYGVDGTPGYHVTFRASERRTAIVCYTPVGEEHKRISVCRHTHRDGYMGAWANNDVCYAD